MELYVYYVCKGKIVNEIIYKPIGVVHSPFKKPKGTPIQPAGAEKVDGTIEIFPEYTDGLKDLEDFSHIILIYHFNLSKDFSLIVKPFMDDDAHGVFAMRGSSRPNPIGISVVRLIGIKKNILHIQDVDIVDGTPLLDIKPYVPGFDIREVDKIGWLEKNIRKLSTTKDDERFIE
ncbi:tRNA (N6-threonylcarbamoyladenosine(37)-N6)-methyltransferase TrmO [bacterium]|nr:tRNA (N6-threonylcarbamoyladenosine(37)-N6)-methyltransferase TrmO [bacterium]